MLKSLKYWIISLFILTSSCTDDSGLIDPDTLNSWENFTAGSDLLSDQVQSLYEDSNQQLWVGTSDGIMVYDGDTFTPFPTINSQLQNINSITEDDNGDIWIGSTDGLGVFDGNDWGFFNLFGNFELGVVALHTDPEGNVWMGTTILGILIFPDLQSNPTQIFDSSCESCNDINVFETSPSGDIWIGSDGNLQLFDGNTIEAFTIQDGLPDNTVTALEYDQWGNLWVGTFNGSNPVILENNQFRSIRMNNGLDLNPILDMVQLDQGEFWVGLVSGGIYNYDGAVMRADFDPEGPGQITTLSMIEDSQNNVWIGTFDSGLWKFSPN